MCYNSESARGPCDHDLSRFHTLRGNTGLRFDLVLPRVTEMGVLMSVVFKATRRRADKHNGDIANGGNASYTGLK
jgi:hypothetical protein